MSKIILFAGARGSGKTTILNILSQKKIDIIPKYATRKKRLIDDLDLIFVNKIQEKTKKYSYTKYGIEYAINKNDIRERIELQEISVASLSDIQTIKKIKSEFKDNILLCWIEPHFSKNEIEKIKKLSLKIGNNTNNNTNVDRLYQEHQEIFDFTIYNNGDIDNIESQLELIIQSAKSTQEKFSERIGVSELKLITSDLIFANNKIKNYLAKNPKEIFNLTPRQFENLIASILFDIGYEVELTAQTKDGGFDIKALKKDNIGSFLTLVECKRYNPRNPVRVSLIREFWSVNELNKSNKGIIFTSSYFTKDAIELANKFASRIDLKDYNDILHLLKKYNNYGQ